MTTETRDDIRQALRQIAQHAHYLRAHSADSTTNAAAVSVGRLAREIEALMTAPEPDLLATGDTFTIAGHIVTAPGFDAASFDRAIKRAHDEGLWLEATDRADLVLCLNPSHGTAYTVSRHTCSCKSTRPCKHRALAVMFADILHSLPQPTLTGKAVA